jgi:hypothetical protein
MAASGPSVLQAADVVVKIDSVDYNLRERPSAASRVVLTARDQLAAQLDMLTLGDDLGRVARLVHMSRTAAVAAGYDDLACEVQCVASKVAYLFDATGDAFSKFQSAAGAVLNELPVIVDQTTSGLAERVEEAASALDGNDELAMELAGASEVLAAALEAAADDARRALESAQKKRGVMDADSARLQKRLDELSVDRAGAWAAHVEVLEGLTEASRLYLHASRKERAAARRARLYGLFGFVSMADGWLRTRFHVSLLSPLTDVLDGVQRDAARARAETRLVMDGRIRQRRLNTEALNEIGRLSKGIREVKTDCDAVIAAVESLSSVAAECKRLSLVVARVASFWRKVHASLGRLSSRDVVSLIEKTVMPGILAASGLETGLLTTSALLEADIAGQRPNASAASDVDAEVGIADASFVDTNAGAAASALSPSSPQPLCNALKKHVVVYYSRWAALSDVCHEGSAQVSEARALALPLLAAPDQDAMLPNTASSLRTASSSAASKRQVENLAARLREELSDIYAAFPENATRSIQPPPAAGGVGPSGKRQRESIELETDLS